MRQVLRSSLYDQLKRRFKNVKVWKAGMAAQFSNETGEDGRLRRTLNKAKGDTWGEIYSTNCPLCNDTRNRLDFSHVWGQYDPVTGDDGLWLVHCKNEDCFAGYEERRSLFDQIWASGPPLAANDTVIKGRKQPDGPVKMELPGYVWPMDKMPATHPAKAYLLGRRFNADWLGRQFGISYLIEPKAGKRYLAGRIIIPIYLGDLLVGWQARYVGKPPSKEIEKYLSAPSMPRGQILYNFDSAKKCPFVVVTEGPMDVWRFGPEAVAVLGKPGGMQPAILAANWREVIVLLDPDAEEDSQELVEQLKKSIKVAKIDLPDGKDPADFYDVPALREYVFAAAREQGLTLGGSS